MRSPLSLLAIYLILSVARYTSALHLYFKSGESKCFYESLREGNLLVGDIDGYVERDSGQFVDDPKLLVGISVYEMFDNDERVLNQHNSHSGDFTLTALETGEHKICINPIYPMKDVKIRIFMEFDIFAAESLDSRRKQDVLSLRERIAQLMERLHRIRTVQRFIREEEADFRNESESANSRILRWSLSQVVALVIICALQLRYLKNFFVKQKIL